MAHSTDQETPNAKQHAKLKEKPRTWPKISGEDEFIQMAAEQSDDVDENNTSLHHLHRHHPRHHLEDGAKAASSPSLTLRPSRTTTPTRISPLSHPNQLSIPSLLNPTPPPNHAASAPKAKIMADRPAHMSHLTRTLSPNRTPSGPAEETTAQTTTARQAHMSHPTPTMFPTHTVSPAVTAEVPTERFALAGPGLCRPKVVLPMAEKQLEPLSLASGQEDALRHSTKSSKVGPQKRSRSDVESGEYEDELDSNVPPQSHSRKRIQVQVQYDRNGMPRLQHAPSATPNAVPFRPRPNDVASGEAAMQAATPVAGTPTPAMRPAWQPDKKKFSLLGAIVEDSSLIIELVSCLDIPSLISLYAIDKKFHWYYNKNVTAFILASVRTWAPGAEKIYPWRCYEHLCIKDPIKRQKEKSEYLGPDIAKLNLFSRDCPSMRWLQMVVWREGVVTDMVIQLTIKALRVPPGTVDAVKVS